MENPKRTNPQNKSIHLFCDKLATELNSRGYDLRVVLKPSYKIRWDKDSVKENLWKPLQRAMYHLDSTTELDTSKVSRVHQELMQILIDNPNLPELDYIDFPSQETTDNYLKSFTK